MESISQTGAGLEVEAWSSCSGTMQPSLLMNTSLALQLTPAPPQSLIVMPGCKLEVWDKGSGLEDAVKQEKKSPNAGNIRDNKDRCS